jgi:hypothetical protein
VVVAPDDDSRVRAVIRLTGRHGVLAGVSSAGSKRWVAGNVEGMAAMCGEEFRGGIGVTGA